MSAAQKKDDPGTARTAAAGGRSPRRQDGQAKAPANGNGASHVLAEEMPATEHRPFAPGKIEQQLHRRVNASFLEYASYVIRDRAIPSLADGLKPVQRRILWALHEKDDGRFIKVANVVGHAMQYHPHGDVSISDALVVLANKRYLIEGQGNFGNIFTGDVRPPRAVHRVPAHGARAQRNLQRRNHGFRARATMAATGSPSRCPPSFRCC